MKEFDESDINRDTVDVHFWWGRTYEEFRERCKKTVPLPAHATYFSDVVDATLSYQKGKDKVKYFVVTYPYSENERNIYLKSDQMGTLHQIPKWKMRFKSYDTFLKDCIDIMKKDFRTYHEENTFDASKNPVDNPIYLKGGIPMYQFNRDAIDTTSFSEKHYQTLRDFITSDKPLANDGESYGSLEYNDGRHQISCNISAVPAFNEDGSKLDKKEVELVMNIDGEEHDIVETLSAEKLASENYQDLMDFCTYVMEQEVVEREQKKESVQAKDETQWASGTIYITPHADIPFPEMVHDVAKILQERGFTTVFHFPSKELDIPRLAATKGKVYLETPGEITRNSETNQVEVQLKGGFPNSVQMDLAGAFSSNPKRYTCDKVNRDEGIRAKSDEEFMKHCNAHIHELDSKILESVQENNSDLSPEQYAVKRLKDDWQKNLEMGTAGDKMPYLPDQFTGTSKEGVRLERFLHQEVETMKRFGLLKEDVHTGKLSVGKPIEQVANR